ncbi:hypothetical protein R84B8_02571 [Treponema sp. R8-4-B8]
MAFSIIEINDIGKKNEYLEELFSLHCDNSINYECYYLCGEASDVLFAAFDNDKLIGLVDGYKEKPPLNQEIGCIWDYVILSKYKEMEVANNLYKAIEKYFYENGCERIIVTFPFLEDTEMNNEVYEYELYSKNGFRDIEVVAGLRPYSEYHLHRRMIKYLDKKDLC